MGSPNSWNIQVKIAAEPPGAIISSVSYQHLLDVELQVRDRVRKIADHFDRCVAAPTLTGQIAGTELVVGG